MFHVDARNYTQDVQLIFVPSPKGLVIYRRDFSGITV